MASSLLQQALGKVHQSNAKNFLLHQLYSAAAKYYKEKGFSEKHSCKRR